MTLRSKVTPGRRKIDSNDPAELKYWIRHLGVTPEELRRAIERVGNSASAVRKEIQNRKGEPLRPIPQLE
jgi:hypothetical protein